LRYLFFVFLFLHLSAGAQINVNNFIFRSQQAIVSNNYTEAIDLLNAVINVRADLYDPFFLRAIAKYNLGDYKGAERDLTRALEIKPNFPDALLYRGVTRERMMNFSDALRDFDRALQLDAYNDNIIVSKAFTKTLQEDYHAAIELCDQALKINKRNERAFLCRAWCKYQIYDMEGALADYTQAIRLNRFNADTYTKRGMVRAFMLKYNEALEDLYKAHEMDSLNLHTLYQLAFVHRELENDERALGYYNQMIRIDPSSAMAYFERGQMLAEFGDTDDALEDFTMVIVLTGGHMLTYFNRGSLYFEKGKYSAAVEDLSKAIDMYPGFAEAYYNRALAYSRMGMQYQAQRDAEKAQSIKAELYTLDATGQQRELDKIKELARISEDFQGSDGQMGRIQNKRINIKPAPDYFVLPERWVPDSLKSQVTHLRSLSEMTSGDGRWVVMSHVGWTPARADEVQQQLNAQLAENPDNSIALLQQGVLFQLMENYDLAKEVYEAVLQQDDQNALALLNRSYVLHKMLFLFEAYEQSISDLPQRAPMSEEIQENYAQIAKGLERITLIRPEFVPARFNLANLNAAIGNYSAAVEQYESIISDESSLQTAHFNLALTLLYLNNKEEACGHLSTSGELGYSQAYSVMKRYCQP
jgi:tetratricopeptide (TPR) repeat protein